MKLIAIAAASALMMLGTAHAQSASPLYGELGYTFLKFKDDAGDSAKPGAVRAVVGYDLHRYVAVEGLLAIGAGSDNGLKLKNTFGVFVKPKYDFGNIEAFARLGWAHSKAEGCDSTGACGTSSGNDAAYGVGVNYHFNPKMYVGLDYMRYYHKDGLTVNGTTLAFGYRF